MWIALLLAPCAAPQSTLLSSTPLPTDVSTSPASAEIVEGANGTVFVSLPEISRLGPGSFHAIEVHRIDVAGRLRWSSRIPVPIAASSDFWMDVDPGDHAVVGYQASAMHGGALRPAPEVSLLNPDGSARWHVTLDPIQGEDTRVWLAAVGFADEGHVLVAGYDFRTPSAIGGPAGGAFVRALDRADGSELWSRDIADVERVDALIDGGRATLFSQDRDEWMRFRRVDGAGALIGAPADVHGTNGPTFPLIAGGAAGEGTLFNTKGAPGGWRTGRLNRGGSVEWLRDGRLNPAGGGIVDAAGTAWMLDAEQRTITQVRPDGITSGVRDVPSDVLLSGDVVPLASGGFAVAGQTFAGPASPVVVFFSDLGFESSRQLFESAPDALLLARALTAASDGTLLALCHGTEDDPSSASPFPLGLIEAVRTAVGAEVSRATCAPAVATVQGLLPTLRAFGRARVQDNDLHLVVDGVPPATGVMFLNGGAPGGGAAPFGIRGELCIGGGVGRHDERTDLHFADARGTVSLRLDLDAIPRPGGPAAVMAGTSLHFQAWYRDEGRGALTGAVAVDFH